MQPAREAPPWLGHLLSPCEFRPNNPDSQDNGWHSAPVTFQQPFVDWTFQMSTKAPFIPLSLAVLTVSDTRTIESDTSGQFLVDALIEAGHRLQERKLLHDDRYAIRAQVAAWIADANVHGILITGGTGFTGRDSTPEAVLPLLDKEMPGFGELFRAISFEEIGTSSLQSRAFAGLSNQTFVFALPGSTSACRTAWEMKLEERKKEEVL